MGDTSSHQRFFFFALTLRTQILHQRITGPTETERESRQLPVAVFNSVIEIGSR